MTMPTVQHFTLSEALPTIRSTYLSHLAYNDGKAGDEDLHDHPGSYSVRANGALIEFQAYHGRMDPAQDMDDWGFDGPTFLCSDLVHDPDRVLLQHCDPQSVALAQRLGLTTHGDTVVIDYHADMLVIPAFRDGQPAYFGDHQANLPSP